MNLHPVRASWHFSLWGCSWLSWRSPRWLWYSCCCHSSASPDKPSSRQLAFYSCEKVVLFKTSSLDTMLCALTTKLDSYAEFWWDFFLLHFQMWTTQSSDWNGNEDWWWLMENCNQHYRYAVIKLHKEEYVTGWKESYVNDTANWPTIYPGYWCSANMFVSSDCASKAIVLLFFRKWYSLRPTGRIFITRIFPDWAHGPGKLGLCRWANDEVCHIREEIRF